MDRLLRRRGLLDRPGRKPPAREPLPVTRVASNRVFLIDQDNAQSLIRLEAPDGVYDPTNELRAILYREYFGGGMSSVVFQELREARSLAYSAWGWYFIPPWPDEENIVAGFIGTQTDKTCDALDAFLELFHDMPTSEAAFQDTLNSLESEIRTDPTPYRDILGTVQAWSRLGHQVDPRAARLAALPDMTMERIAEFQRRRVKGKPWLISIVGKKSEIDLDRLRKIGPITELTVDDIFTP